MVRCSPCDIQGTFKRTDATVGAITLARKTEHVGAVYWKSRILFKLVIR